MNGVSRSAVLRGGVAASVAAVGGVALSGTALGAPEEDAAAPPDRIRRAYRRQTTKAGGAWYSYLTLGGVPVIDDEPDFVIHAASVNKLAMATAVLDKVDRGELSLARKVELTPDSIIRSSSGMYQLQQVYGDQLTLAGVLTSLLLLSDDSSTRLIATVLPAAELNQILATKGFTHTRVEPDDEHPGRFFHGHTTPREIHTLLRKLAGKTLLRPASCDFMLNILRWSEPGYVDGVRRNMSSAERFRVATKYGAYQDERHEVGIVHDQRDQPALVYSFFANQLPDRDNYGATNPGAEAYAALGRVLLEATGTRSAAREQLPTETPG